MTHPDQAFAAQAIAQHVADIEKKFLHVRVPEPCAYVAIGGGAVLRKPSEPMPEIAEETIKIPFVRITSDPLVPAADGKKTVYATPAEAISAWRAALDIYLSGYPSAETLFWRVRPDIVYEVDFETDRRGWSVYSRLAVH